MNRQARLQALSAFLKNQRAKLLPSDVGLPDAGRRRTPGLRREEIAQLAGVSTTWYTWLEQGRDIQVSASVLDSVAGALRLTVDERKYLFSLAMDKGTVVAGAAPDEPPRISPSLQLILRELRSCPTVISDRRSRIVGWNEAAAQVFVDFEQVPPAERNMIRLLFTRKELQRLAVNWEHFVGGFLAIFRADYGQYVEDEWYERFIDEMKKLHPDFARLWEQSRVSSAPELLIEFRHSRAGKMQFHLASLQVQGATDLRCSVYTPAPDTPTASKVLRLVGERSLE